MLYRCLPVSQFIDGASEVCQTTCGKLYKKLKENQWN